MFNLSNIYNDYSDGLSCRLYLLVIYIYAPKGSLILVIIILLVKEPP
jgi:hypothetical protein